MTTSGEREQGTVERPEPAPELNAANEYFQFLYGPNAPDEWQGDEDLA